MPNSNRQKGDRWWSIISQVALVVGLTAGLWFARWAVSSPSADWPDVVRWLESEGFSRSVLLFKTAGICSLLS